ncbi:GAF domain-containing sensor histidine kinase [Candidatus Solirubrobacter pratensis]|uniref:GAF domain-containing sensor histidine kinase n=1 Tax=Candidatus Solirubrobacter pratensis TaxID=1298857 RepID=UPI00041A1F4E|nr:GAF domain-containing sensor histidine kinase [Candidatus Solirubrobacter pratensis]
MGYRARTDRSQLEQHATEQAALRRVATLVAQNVPPSELFGAVAREIGTLLGADYSGMLRYEDGGTVAPVATWAAVGEHPPVPDRWRTEPGDPTTMIAETRQPARVEDWTAVPGPIAAFIHDELGVRCSVGSPIMVEGRLWGGVAVHSKQRRRLPADTESRLQRFTELVATAIANADARAELARLAQEQAGLRRVATLVAEGASPTAVFDAVAAEMEALLDADQVALSRYEPGAEITVVAYRGSGTWRVPPGTRVSHEGESVTALVHRTERPARVDGFARARGAIAEIARTTGARGTVGAPIVVEGRLWGVIVASWTGEEPPPADTEERMAKFAQLLDTAIANADSRDQLTASRSRLLTEADEARRRVVRDLHDGAQQRLVHTIVTLKLAQRALRQGGLDAASLVDEALEQAERSNAELRELAHGILPAILTRGGLQAGVDTVVHRLELPVEVDVTAERLPPEIEASAYFIVAEALTNVVKHSRAGRAEVTASVRAGALRVEVRDDGVGGADPAGHGLVGIGDRATALGGRLRVESPAGGGTVVAATLPLPA